MWVVIVRLVEWGSRVARFERAIGPFRSEDAAKRTAAIVRRRAKRYLNPALSDHNAEVEVEVFALDNRAARYHFHDVAEAAETAFLRFDP